jgi:hypothetical protein
MVSKIEQEVNEIRLKIYETIKDMTPEEQVEYFNKRGEALAKKYGLKVYNSLDEIDWA